MDAFGDLLRGVRSHGSVFGYSTLSAPWSVDFVEGAPLTLCVIVDGGGWIVREGQEPLRVAFGDCVVVRGPEPFSFRDAKDTTAAMVTGAYPVHGEIGDRLMEALPPVLRVPVDADEDAAAVARFLASEVAADRPGQQIVLDRLLDWLLVCTLRAWFDDQRESAPPWYSAQHDPVVGPVLRLVHSEIGAPWTVAALARRAGVSRATLAKRFTDLVGEPPLTYLTRWRMTVAADRLADQPDLSIAAVAHEVGYADAFAFSNAFKRVKGVNPSTYRAQAQRVAR
ncbi:AraC family transcriptional regulator [Streptomyces sp. NPDC093591]|uniref:AraC family transcriptional regulator n=1 Tax=Streptomyces sp. NPDC093591 TaxID=3366044 RepID=UPI0038234BEE